MFGKSNAGLVKKLILIASTAIAAGVSLIFVLSDGQENIKSENLYAEQIIRDCEGVDRPHCYINALEDIAKREGLSSVLLAFKDLISKYEESTYYCHPQAHHLGMWLYGYIGNLTEALSYADQKCGGAVYHGLVQNFFSTQSFKGRSPAEIDITKICPLNPENPHALERWQCLHGIGHGLAATYDYDVFTAVQRCDELEPGWEQLSCSKGVFMQNLVNYYQTGVGAFDEDDLLFPCNVVDAKYAPACYHYHATHIFYHGIQNGRSATDSFKECDKIVPEEFVKHCYYGMGRQMSIVAFVSMEALLDICQSVHPRYQTDCFTGSVMTLVNNKGTDQAFQFCKLLREDFKADCYDGLGKWALMLHSTKEGMRKECSRAESSHYFEICMKASLEDLELL